MLLFDEDQHMMKVENVFLLVERLVMVHEHMKCNNDVVDIVVLRLLLFLIDTRTRNEIVAGKDRKKK